MIGDETILNNQYALFKSGVDLLLKAISVFSNDNIAQKYLLFYYEVAFRKV